MVGGAFANYRILGPIGQGGMGAVYRAEHVLLGRPAAVKVLLPELSRNQEIVNRFFNEARAATAIRHPGIVEIYDFGYAPDGSAYIVMELLDGESLARRRARVGRMAAGKALALVRQIAGALAAAHAKGIVHRDLKPDNVFVVADPEVPGGERIKLLDFGIAKLAADQTGSMHTRTGAVMGTPTYMAPEQCRGVALDHRADLYSLGCILFEMVCGVPPFRGEGSGDVLAAHIHVPPPAPRSFAPELPAAVDALILRLLAKAPDARPATAGHLIGELDAIAMTTTGSQPIAAAPAPGTATDIGGSTTLSSAAGPTGVDGRPGARRWRLLAALGALAALVGAVVALWGGGEPDAPAAAIVVDAATPPDAAAVEAAATIDAASIDAAPPPDAAAVESAAIPDAAPTPDAASAPAIEVKKVRRPRPSAPDPNRSVNPFE